MVREDRRKMLVRDAMRGVIFGAGVGLIFAKCNRNKDFGAPMAIGAFLGALGASYLCTQTNASQMLGGHFVGWAPPPHPIDVIASFDPHASARDQARSVLNNYLFDNATRDWADDGTVKRAFGQLGKPVHKKEDLDPAMLIAAYETPQSKVWSIRGGRNSWVELNRAV